MKKTDTAIISFTMASILTLLRIPLKLFNISPDTGFYDRSNIFGSAFMVLFVFCLLLGAGMALRNREDFKLPLRTGLIRAATAFFTGCVIAGISAFELFFVAAPIQTGPNAVPPMLSRCGQILGIIGGISLVFMALSVFSGNSNRLGKIASLTLPCWCAVSMLHDFMGFRFVLTASDQLMHTIFMLIATVFFLQLSKEIIYDCGSTLGIALPAAVAFIAGVPLGISQLCTLVLVGDFVGGPSYLQVIHILVLCFFQFMFLLSPIKKRDPRLGEKSTEQ
ncbi:MAG: hypothetical protein RR315_04125 [Oscillospiraceae bacterium]